MDNAKLNLVNAWWAKSNCKVEGFGDRVFIARGVCEHTTFVTKARKTQGGPFHN